MLSGSGWSFVSQTISKLVVLGSSIAWARTLSVSDFGLVLSLQAVMLFAAYLWDMGMSAMATRELAASGMRIASWLRGLTIARLWLLPIPVLVMAGGALALGVHTSSAAYATAVIGLTALTASVSLIFIADLTAHLEFRQTAAAMAAGRLMLLFSSVAVAILQPGSPLVAVAGCLLFGEIVSLIVLLKYHFARPAASGSGADQPEGTRRPQALMRRSLPYAFNGFFNFLYVRLDIVLVSLLAGTIQGGLYAPASRLQDALMLMPTIAVAGLVPVAARAHQKNTAALKRALRFSQVLSLGLALPTTVLAFLLCPVIFPAVLGDAYKEAVVPAQILVWSVAFAAIEIPLLSVIIAMGHAAWATVIYGTALITTVTAHILLDPTHKAVGGAIASLVRFPITLIVTVAVFLHLRRQSSVARANELPRSQLGPQR